MHAQRLDDAADQAEKEGERHGPGASATPSCLVKPAIGLLDPSGPQAADYTLVLTGPRSAAVTSRGTTSPIVVSAVYLFRNDELLANLGVKGVKIGVATSVARNFWDAAEIYSRRTGTPLPLDERQRDLLALLAPVPQLL
jgi:hypothetical protein